MANTEHHGRPATADDAPRPGVPAGPPRLPRTYLVWLSGALASFLGDSMLYFALGWAATAHGGAVAGLVLTAVNLPRVALLLVGGAVGDRFGARRVMIAGDSAMLVVSLLLAAFSYHLGAEPWLLITTGVLIGVVDAFYLPASGSMPRRLVGKDRLPRALALRQAGAQLITMGGGPLGGVLVGLAGLAGAALVNAVTFALVLVVLITIKSSQDLPAAGARQNVLREAADGVRVGFGDAVLRPGLLLVAAAAGCLLPVMPLLLPLLAREQHWSAGATGLVVGAQGLGMVAVTLGVVRRGPLGRPGLMAACGLMVAGLGVLALALAPDSGAALGAGLVTGLGNGLFSSHIGPLIMTVTPESHLSRIQALLTLVQSLPLLVMNNVLGNLAGLAGVTLAVAMCALAVAGTGLLALASRPLRTTRTGLEPVRKPE
ncbi:MFS transporter [Streptomyces jumonjinensis]|uniref:MFS transporter n=1 Tax=Streptomyces jumonjinensis TaxID=1945 RepID=A0A646KP88_STRJU|nr:MFS transporter [Streptomyces jumonjinensis]MQT04144.1 MFS transporter [Streptomyces jumonjinensis]